MTTNIFIASLLFALMQRNYFSNQQWKCTITTSDALGAVLRTHIFVHRDATLSKEDADNVYISDKLGKLDISLPEGFYDICVTASAFSPQCRKVEVRMHDVDLNFKLNVSEEITKQFGDQFPTN